MLHHLKTFGTDPRCTILLSGVRRQRPCDRLGVFGKGGFLDHRSHSGAQMRQKSGPEKTPAEQVVKDIRRATRRQFSAEEKIRIVLEGVRGEESIAELCRREGIASSMYYGWSKEFLVKPPPN